jgi:xanthine dehydrogenase accessory factor
MAGGPAAPDQGLLESAAGWLEAGQRVWLLTVLSTAGPSPRPPGSLLALCGDGRLVGSVSGGCVEEDLLRRVQGGDLDGGLPRRLEYGLTADQAGRLGLPCGGHLELLAERLEDAAPLRRLAEALAGRRSLTRRVCLVTGEASLHPGAPGPLLELDERWVRRGFGPRYRLLLTGANDIARHLVPIAVSLDYEVLLSEPREEYRRSWADLGDGLPAPESLMPDDLVRRYAGDARCAVVTLTHDPRLDDLALMEALATPAFYVGALGSRRSSRARRERLRGLGLGLEALTRLRGPVGLPLGGRTPAEIAVAIAADLVAVAQGRRREMAALLDGEQGTEPG